MAQKALDSKKFAANLVSTGSLGLLVAAASELPETKFLAICVSLTLVYIFYMIYQGKVDIKKEESNKNAILTSIDSAIANNLVQSPKANKTESKD